MTFALVQFNGPSPGYALKLNPDGKPVTIGRDESHPLIVEDHLCSRLHAKIWFDSDNWQVEDCQSRNGTFLNSQPIERAILRPGDVIRIGERIMFFVKQYDPDDPATDGWEPSKLATSTFVLQIREPEKREAAIIGQIRESINQRQMKGLAILCRLAGRLYKQESAEALVNLISSHLSDGINATTVGVWLTGTDGRLKLVGGSHLEENEKAKLQTLASIALENGALLVGDEQSSLQSSGQDSTIEVSLEHSGISIGVPIPGQSSRRGAIVCYCDSTDDPFVPEDLELAIAIANQGGLALQNLEHIDQLRRANQQLKETVAIETKIIGESPQLLELLNKTRRVASTHSTVLVRGESGSGKELVARMLHDASPRSDGPYVTVNCAAFNESLLESELFGHEQGAFTGADRRRLGQFERAHKGTIFLDEIGEMSTACQSKLLRILEGHPFERLGGSESIEVDVRMVSATHRDLKQMVEQGTFRKDLYYRLCAIELIVPRLSERTDDILILATHFFGEFQRSNPCKAKRLSAEASKTLMQYDWPGNVRELKNTIERAAIWADGEEISIQDLGIGSSQKTSRESNILITLDEAKHRHVVKILAKLKGNKTQAGKVLGIGRGTLYNILEEGNRNGWSSEEELPNSV